MATASDSSLARDEFLTGVPRKGKRKGGRKPEQKLNDKIRRAILSRDPVRVENAVGDGTPDINYIGGWIESKVLPRWPKRADTPVKVAHYRPDQRAWHTKRRAAGGRVHVVLDIAGTVFMFDAADAALGLGTWTREQMVQRALLVLCPWDGDRFKRFLDTCDSDRH